MGSDCGGGALAGGFPGGFSGFGAERLDFFQLVSWGGSGVHSHVSAIERNDGSCDPRGCVGSEEQCDAANIVGLSESIGGDSFEEA